MRRHQHTHTLFPYTTLFRSSTRRSPTRPAACSTTTRSPRCVPGRTRSEEHTSELQSLRHLVCRLLLEKKKILAAHAHDTATPDYLVLPTTLAHQCSELHL